VERELKQVREFIEVRERNRPPEDTGDDHPDSSVPAPVKPGPLGAIGAVALPHQTRTTLRYSKGIPLDAIVTLKGSLAKSRYHSSTRVKTVFPVLTRTIARGPSHAACVFAEDRHAVTSRRTCS
jgi:hypothetical protein